MVPLGLEEGGGRGKGTKTARARAHPLGPSPFSSSTCAYSIHLECPCKMSPNKRILLALTKFENIPGVWV